MQQDYSYPLRTTGHDHVPQPPIHMHRLPKGHGPAVALPTFVLAQGQYDDLGRSIDDGYDVSVGRGKKKGDARSSGPGAFDFWKDLDLGQKTMGEGSVGSSGSGSGAGISLGGSSGSTMIKPLPRDRQRSTTGGPTKLVVPRSEWFIRKALLAKAQKENQAILDQKKDYTPSDLGIPAGGPTLNDSAISTPSPASPPPTSTPPPTSSLASLLSLPPPGQTPYEPPTYFHIKPNNKGYQLLEKGGWSGVGGLGRPEGWDEVRRGVKREEGLGRGEEVVKREEGEVGLSSGLGVGEKREEPIDVDAIIDLTGGDDDDDDDDETPRTTSDPSPPSRFGEQQLITADILSQTSHPPLIGPGRVAPIATYLKHDLSGIGHTPHRSYTSLRPTAPAASGGRGSMGLDKKNHNNNNSDKKKKITHTLADIKAVQRGKVVMGLSDEGLEMRRRGKAKRDAKREKEDRRKWQQIIAA